MRSLPLVFSLVGISSLLIVSCSSSDEPNDGLVGSGGGNGDVSSGGSMNENAGGSDATGAGGSMAEGAANSTGGSSGGVDVGVGGGEDRSPSAGGASEAGAGGDGMGGTTTDGAGGQTDTGGGDGAGGEGVGGSTNEKLEPYRKCDENLGRDDNPGCDEGASCLGGGRCNFSCEVDPDSALPIGPGDECPLPLTGNATRTCGLEQCTLRCLDGAVCPDGMLCEVNTQTCGWDFR